LDEEFGVIDNEEFAHGSGDRELEFTSVLGDPNKNFVGFFAFNSLSFDLDEKLRIYSDQDVHENELELTFSTRYSTKVSRASGNFFYAHN